MANKLSQERRRRVGRPRRLCVQSTSREERWVVGLLLFGGTLPCERKPWTSHT